MRSDNEIIQGLWIGERLSTMEQLSIRSFQAHGHTYHLYAYQEIRDVPHGVVILDANQILPESAIFRYAECDSVAGFTNFFRYKLLLERGGWWMDTDVVCLQPFDFDDPYVFASQHNQFLTAEEVCAGIIKAPRGCEFAEFAWNVCKAKDTKTLRWGETGPVLTQAGVAKFDLARYARPAAAFCPVPFKTWTDILDGNCTWNLGADTFGVHLWNELWRREARDKDATYHPNCLYEQLKRRSAGGQAC